MVVTYGSNVLFLFFRSANLHGILHHFSPTINIFLTTGDLGVKL